MKGLGLALALLVTAIEPVMGDTDLFKYALTQGGLLLVVLVLLWGYRREFRRQLDDKDAEIQHKEERLQVFMAIVTQSTAAMTRSADACDRMARAAENLERRR